MIKKTTYLFLILFSLSICSYSQITITIDDAYFFNRINNSYIFLEYSNKNSEIYKPDQNGIFKLNNVAGKVSVTFYAENYQAVKSHFNIADELTINAILLPDKAYEKPTNDDNIMIEGVVRSITTGEIIKNASINFNKINTKLTADSKGMFFLKKEAVSNDIKEGDTFSYTVQAKNYKDKTVIYRFSDNKGYKCVYLEPLQKKQIKTAQVIFDNLLKKKIINKLAQNETKNINTECDDLPETIRVGTNCVCNDCNSVSVMSIETYVQKGLDDEWIPSWSSESLKSGSLPYKTYGAYHVLHPIHDNYDISNTTCKQVWEDDFYPSCVDAAIATQGEYLVTSGDNIAFSEYSAENNGLNAPAGTGCGDGFSGTGSDYPCISDDVCTGHDRYGHGRGMCQWGTQRWALQGKNYQWIADHYYNPADIFRCDAILVFLDCSSAVDLNCAISYHGNNSSDPSNVTYYGCNNWDETGPERVHTITPASSGTLTATVSNFTGDLDVYILGSCDPSDCLGTVSSSSATYDNAQAGYTYYIVVDADDGSGSSYDLIVDCNASSTADLIIQDISVFPNPTTGIIYIDNPTGISITEISVTNTLGQVIKKVKNINNTIDFSGFSTGMYFIKLVDKKGRKISYKIIKE